MTMEHISEELISQWLDREADARRSRLVENHLRDCESCRAIADEFAAVNRTYRAAEALEPPPHLWPHIAARLEAEGREEKRGFLRVAWRPDWMRIPVWAPALILVFIIGSTIAYVEHRAAVRAQLAAVTEIETAHQALMALNIKNYNPFHERTDVDAGANPLTQWHLKDQPNPFRNPPGRP